MRLVNHLVEREPGFDFEAELERFILRAERTAFGPSTQAILDEAVARDIPWLRLNEYSLVQLGQGIYQQRIRATMTSKTSSLAVDVAGDKELTARLLAAAGLPVPRSYPVRDVEEAVAAARRLGFPLVVKPLDGNHGRGVLDLRREEEVAAAFPAAQAEAGRARSWSRPLSPATTTGSWWWAGGWSRSPSGSRPMWSATAPHTVAQLVEQTNADPRRGVGHEKVLTRIRVDQAAVELVRDQGFELDACPERHGQADPDRQHVDRRHLHRPDRRGPRQRRDRRGGGPWSGWTWPGSTSSPPIWPSRCARPAGRSSRSTRLPASACTPTRPWASPSTWPSRWSTSCSPRQPGRIPIVAVTGTNGKTTTARMIAHIFKGMGRQVGLTSTDGILIDERLVVTADASGPRSARMVLQNPRVDFAVFEVARGGILREGLGYERNDVGVVLNIGADHLGLRGIDTLKQLAAVKQVVIEAVPRDGHGVLNADDPLVAGMRRHCSGELVYFSMEDGNELVDTHCRRGGRAIVLEDGRLGEGIVFRQGRRSTLIAPPARSRRPSGAGPA